MAFSNCVFVPKAKELERNKIIMATRSKEELADYYIEKIRDKDNELDEYRKKIWEKDSKITRLNRVIDELNEEKKAVLRQLDDAEQKHKEMLKVKDEEIKRYEALLNRPQRPDGVIEWVEKYLSGKLILHERAKDMMRKITPEKVNLPLVCDALEHLATDFRDELRGNINEDERRLRSSKKIQQEFWNSADKGPCCGYVPQRV
jgi:hypothetical protein